MREPKCPYFGQCGGCATQHLTYEAQLENKRKTLEKEIGFSNISVHSGEEWFYRNRMDLTFCYEGLGFRAPGKWWKIVPVEKCVISTPRLNELMKEIVDFFGPAPAGKPENPYGFVNFDAFNVKTMVGTFKYAVIRTPQNDSSISIALNKNSATLERAVSAVQAFAKVTTANHVLITYMKDKTSQSVGDDYEVLKGSDQLEEKILGKTLRYSAQGFFQNNSVMAERMHEYVHGLLKAHEPPPYAHLLDLYGGVGAFGIVNADLFHKVTTVESFEGCTVAAKANITLNGLSNVEAICMDAARLKQVPLPNPPKDGSPNNLYVITDPPRSGMAQETVIQLKKLKPKVIIYISCNVEQLGTDLPKFKDYRIKSAALFDLFPQTNHMESVVELVLA